MNASLKTTTQLLVSLIILISETRTSDVRLCPIIQTADCKRNMNSKEDYANIYSSRFCLNFMCDTKIDGGGWIIIQRRVYQDTYFNKTWDAYKHGFGITCSDYWLGNKNIHMITETGSYELRIDMEFQSNKYFAQYEDFYIDSEEKKYRLHISGFSGNVVDELMTHNNMAFSTADRENDIQPIMHCAEVYNTGWWYQGCHRVNLNGHFHLAGQNGQSVVWANLTTYFQTLSSVEMKIRRVNE
ncbi:Ficolin-1 [Bulinus truncatus]|nr:Ficolin-1 [Bulinus truncatus]